MLFFILLIGVFVLWHFIPKSDNTPRPEPKFRIEPRAVATDPQWRRFFYAHCESPAETAFLDAMIPAFNLAPAGGTLRGPDLKLDLQVAEHRYRMDFLANDWLVIEIDGAAYHSSPEAIRADKARDSFMEDLGYSVLRIPAKIVFSSADETVLRVRAALAVGKRPAEPKPEPLTGNQRLNQTIRSIGKIVVEANAHVSRMSAVQEAMSPPKSIFSLEKLVIEEAIKFALHKLEIDSILEEFPDCKEMFEESLRNYQALLPSKTSKLDSFPELVKIDNISPPPRHQNADIDQLIKNNFKNLMEDRRSFFAATRQKIRSNSRLEPYIKDYLAKKGCESYWNDIRPINWG